VLFADCVYTPSVQPVNLVAVGCLQRGERPNIAGLKLVRSMRGEATQNYVVLEAELQDLECFVRSETVGSQVT
jgi:hypothetical protein